MPHAAAHLDSHRSAGDPPPRRASSRGVVVLATIAAVGAAYLGHEVLVPIAFALLLATLLHPVVRWLHGRARVPVPAAATLAVLASTLLVVGIGAALAPPLRGLAADVPKSVAAARARLARIQGPLGAPFVAATSAPKEPAGGAPAGFSGAVGRVFGTTSSVLASTVEALLLALFVLAAGDAWRRRLERAVASPERRRTIAEAAAQMRAAVARYLLATAVINVGQGLLVAIVAWLLHLPSPPLWGVLTFLVEFIPYLGGAALIVLLLVVGLATVGGARAFAMPVAYLAITTLQNNLVSPIVYGRGLRLNPVAILVAVMVGWALWGVAGAFLAVPMLAALRILAEHVDALRPLGAFLEE